MFFLFYIEDNNLILNMILKKILFFLAIIILFNLNSAEAEIIENKKVLNKSFDLWNVSCEDDEMLNDIDCRLFVEVTGGTVFFVNPLSNENPILISSEDSFYNKKMYIKVDNNKLISSLPIIGNRYNIVGFNQNDLKTIFNQIKSGKYLYVRFTIKDITSPNGFKEITAKISLAEFQKALIYHNNLVNKYNFTINNFN